MRENLRIHFIPPIPKREEKVSIYCSVSTNSAEQLQSLTAQISHLTKLTAAMPQWLLADVYMDIATSKTGSSRKVFNRMIEDCQSHKLNIILTKSIRRFGRDIVEILVALNQLKQLGVRVIFEQEELDTAKTDNDFMIAISESLAQAENESRSDNIKMGIKFRAAAGTSKLYDRKCYGYKHDKNGKLIIDEGTAANVKLIFELYLGGQSVLGIIKELEKRKIPSPTGKEKWCKRSIDIMLSNEKCTGDVLLLKSGKSDVNYLASDNNSAIISKELFGAVQMEKEKMSNIEKAADGKRRKSKKYSSKKSSLA